MPAEPSFPAADGPYDLTDRSLAVFRLRAVREEAGVPLSAGQAREVLAPAAKIPQPKVGHSSG